MESECNTEVLHPDDCPEELLCTEESIFDHLFNLVTSKSTECDGISAKKLKSTAASIAPSLTELFNLSVTSGVFPVEWKIGRIAPIPKGNDQTVPSGFRPISILPIVSKVMERHIQTVIESHLQEHAPISPRQSMGFHVFTIIDICIT